MAQRNSGYARKERDAYMTPPWVTAALVDVLEKSGVLPVVDVTGAPMPVWEPACGAGQMADVLVARGYDVIASDVVRERGAFAHDFTLRELPVLLPGRPGAIITNPPYDRAEEFIANALDLMAAAGGVVAMLLPVAFDSARTRRQWFADCPAFALKIVLLDRITWFDPQPGDNTPSENHAWFVWNYTGAGLRRAEVEYVEMPEAERARLAACRRMPRTVRAAA